MLHLPNNLLLMMRALCVLPSTYCHACAFRVLNYALNSKKLKDKLMDTSTLINEANLEHSRAINKVTIMALAKAASTAQAATAADATDDQSSSSKGSTTAAAVGLQEPLLLPLLPALAAARPVPASGVVRLPGGYDFKEQLSEFSFKTLFTKTEVIMALNKIKLESNKVVQWCSLMLNMLHCAQVTCCLDMAAATQEA
jgi:dynein heavy chain